MKAPVIITVIWILMLTAAIMLSTRYRTRAMLIISVIILASCIVPVTKWIYYGLVHKDYQKYNDGICPECGGQIEYIAVIRHTGKDGFLYACENGDYVFESKVTLSRKE